MVHVTEGQYNILPQTMSCQYIDYFELSALEKQQMQEEAFSELPLTCLKREPPKGTPLS